MKTLIKDYVFNPSSKTITFSNLTSLALEQILLITDVTTNTIIYSFAESAKGGTVSGTVLTLDYDTSSLSSTDSLQIFIDTTDDQDGMIEMLRYIAKAVAYARDGSDRMRVAIDSSATLATTSTQYTRNSSTVLGGSTELWYSAGSWNTVDAREQLKAIQDNAMLNTMSRWRI